MLVQVCITWQNVRPTLWGSEAIKHWTQGWARTAQDAMPAKIAPGRNALKCISGRKRLAMNLAEVMLGGTSQEVMPGETSGEVRLTSSGSDAGAFAPGTKRKAAAATGWHCQTILEFFCRGERLFARRE